MLKVVNQDSSDDIPPHQLSVLKNEDMINVRDQVLNSNQKKKVTPQKLPK